MNSDMKFDATDTRIYLFTQTTCEPTQLLYKIFLFSMNISSSTTTSININFLRYQLIDIWINLFLIGLNNTKEY